MRVNICASMFGWTCQLGYVWLFYSVREGGSYNTGVCSARFKPVQHGLHAATTNAINGEQSLLKPDLYVSRQKTKLSFGGSMPRGLR